MAPAGRREKKARADGDAARRRGRRQRWLPFWSRLPWAVLGGLAALGFILGYVGFSKHATTAQLGLTSLDRIYLTLQLVPMNSGALPPPVSWELQVARLLIPAVAAYSAVRAFLLVFLDQVYVLRLRSLKDHIVICGLGQKGYLLAKRFLDRGDAVVVIEQNEDDNLIQPARDLGAIVIVGDATDKETLRRGNVQQARHVIASGGNDGANAEVAVNVRALTGDRAVRPLTCLVHIVDPQLCNLLRERELAWGASPGFRLEFFNVYDLGAQALLDDFPPFDLAPGRKPGDPPHLLLVGLGSMGRSVVVRAARLWRARQSNTRLRIAVVDRSADRKVELLQLRYPRLQKVCELVSLQIDVTSPEFERADFLCDKQGRSTVDVAYICFDNDSLGLAAGLTLLQRIRGQGVQVVVRMASSTGLGSLLRRTADIDGEFEELHVFPLLDRTCEPELQLGGTHEVLARALHDDNARLQTDPGDKLTATEPRPWAEIPDEVREIHRRQADRIGATLRAAGFVLAALADWDAEYFEFDPDEVERMARAEHERVLRETPGRAGSMSWVELPDGERERYRRFVKGLPRFLARAGLQVQRVAEASRDAGRAYEVRQSQE